MANSAFRTTEDELRARNADYLPDHYLQLRQVLDVLEGGGE